MWNMVSGGLGPHEPPSAVSGLGGRTLLLRSGGAFYHPGAPYGTVGRQCPRSRRQGC